jgi:endo-1,4-beta-xylanase
MLSVLFLASLTASIPVHSQTPAPPPLRALADKRGFLIGGAVRFYPETLSDPDYWKTFKREFNVVVPEHAMKFENTQPKKDVYDFALGDRLVAFAESGGMKVRGHALVWHEANPKWVREYANSPEALRTILREHILKVAGHFRGRVLSWDVVNEAIAADGAVSGDGPWPAIDDAKGRAPGDYIGDAFRWAREADPHALLFYNDYGAELINKKSDGIYRLIKGLKKEGAPVDGIGFQAHISYDQDLPEESLRANFKRFSDLGLVIHITEMDVAVPNGKEHDADALQKQARQYEKYLRVCLETPNCQALLTWGLTDKYSWVDSAALLFDRGYAPKPAYDAVKRVLNAGR